MKKQATYLLCLVVCLSSRLAGAQTIYAGESTIDRDKLPGLFLTITGDGRQIEKDWEEQLKTYGRLLASRGTYRVANADIPALSSEPINLVSTVKAGRSSATLFVSFDLGSRTFVRPGDRAYRDAEQLLKDFAGRSQVNQEVRQAELGFDEAQRTHQRLVKNGERLLREIDQNKKEKERLLKRIEENEKELTQLEKDVETNKVEQEKALIEVDNRKSNVEAVKTRRQP
ncbi:hypothetical protein DYU11_11190 [Fibrisoma montanum]|uniref:Uncharacterized protein n=1 Tax=Fibrisoma montanum TaxID=2305895 RepID=A0A418MB38_9BACT|nr:hypothetical protein [Fibrisoma montanum]RIV23546.1 hypothetical protein DYU11_11190 [Fibrisoma montanum]